MSYWICNLTLDLMGSGLVGVFQMEMWREELGLGLRRQLSMSQRSVSKK